ncbi:inhibitory synaptic factor 1-like [Myxocyprinus asiaticus]|uniref:inhibitory synaptic factor 1-like n=1 Tax=Myxocyprinus asiaticus TaxID=70543 RepID=UPI002223388B|nr:inhibitory synaptic factor 1-like [Myxocyprinus asiaticus]
MFHCTLLGPLDLSQSLDRRAEIRRHIKMVMEQLEEVLTELKDVAKELREVVAQIDKLTSDIDLDLEDDLSLVCCSEDHGRSLGDLFHTETLSGNHDLSRLCHNPLLDTVRNTTTVKNRELDLFRRSCGDLPALNGPLRAPNSPKASWLFGSGRRIQYYDKTYHALCCDDDYNEDRGGLRSSRLSSTDSVFSSSPTRFLTPRSTRKTYSSPDSKKIALRSCSTQTVSDKSTQTHFPYIPAKQRPSSDNKN